MNTAQSPRQPKILIFGPGWLGHKLAEYLHAELSSIDITDKPAVVALLDRVRPDVVVNTAGKTGKPNIDWCEDHKQETIQSNIVGPLVLLGACEPRGIRLVHLSSGCIFTGASPHTGGFTELDAPNPVSFYSWTKAYADEVLQKFPVLILRLRMPVDKESNQRNLITKLAGYAKVINVENSITVVDDLLAATGALIEQGATGIYNVANPGPVRHEEILAMYREIVDPAHVYELIGTEELYDLGLAKAGRSNCVLNTTKLGEAGVILPDARERIRESLFEYKRLLS